MEPLNNTSLPPKWSPLGFRSRLRQIIREPSDLWLFGQIGWFIWRVPSQVATENLGRYLNDLIKKRSVTSRSLDENLERILRLAEPWLRLGPFRSRNTCYTRAFVLYRFLAVGTPDLSFRFGIDTHSAVDQRLHGHAWVTVDGIPYGMDDSAIPDNCQIVYTHPPNSNQSGAAAGILPR